MKHKLKFFIMLIVFGFVFSGCQKELSKIVLVEENGDIIDTFEVSDINNFIDSEEILEYTPSKDGYTFSNWTLISDKLDIKIYKATYDINSYELSFETNGGNPLNSVTLNYRAVLSPIENPEKNDFYFAGWFLDSNFNEPLDTDLMPSNDMTLYAKWTTSPFSYRLDDQNDAIITGILLDSDTIEIPNTIDDYDVVSIDSSTFEGHAEIKNLTIPDSVTYLPQGLLKDLIQLTSLQTPFVGEQREQSYRKNTLAYFFYTEAYTGIYIIDEIASYIPKTLYQVNITDSITIAEFAFAFSPVEQIYLNEGLTTIQYDAFSGSNIDIIPIPSTVETIDPLAFVFMENLISITVDKDNPYFSGSFLGRALFNKDYTKLIRYASGYSQLEYEVPESVIEIGEYAFAYSANLVKVYIPDSVTKIGDHAFEATQKLTTVEFSNTSGLKTIGSGAFSESSIVYISIPQSVELIDDYAFYNATRLDSVTFVEDTQLKQIGYNAFFNTHSLKQIIIPLSVTTIDAYAFGGNYLLLTIYCKASTEPEGWSSSWYRLIDTIVVEWSYNNN